MMNDSTEMTAPLSGVRVATSTRGHDISVHTYVGCQRGELEVAGDLAVNEWLRLHALLQERIAELNQRGVDLFAAEVKKRSA